LIYLVRHGRTAANSVRPRRLAGQSDDSPLDEVGVRQAGWARDHLAGRLIEAAYSSPLIRAMRTAEIIAEPHGVEVHSVDGLIESDCGRWDHRSWEWIMENDREAYDLWLERPDIHPYPEGESFTDVAERVECAISAIAERHAGQEILIAAHNTVNKTFLARCMGLTMHFSRTIPYSNGGISVIEYKSGGDFKVRTINMAEKYLG